MAKLSINLTQPLMDAEEPRRYSSETMVVVKKMMQVINRAVPSPLGEKISYRPSVGGGPRVLVATRSRFEERPEAKKTLLPS